MKDESILRIMTAPAAAVGPSDTVVQAKVLMESARINHLPVVDDERFVGIVSSSDLLKLFLLDAGSQSDVTITVDQIMERDPLTIAKSATLRDAAEKLSIGSFHSLPVLDEDRCLVGIVTSTDLIDHLLQHIPQGDGSLIELSPLMLQARNRVLEDVCRAAELYERSGHAEREHAQLMKALEKARDEDDSDTTL